MQRLGKGGFGSVYKARFAGERGFVKDVALKVLHPAMAADGEIASRLRDEARLLGLLQHKAIVKVDRLIRLNDRWTVVMEYVNGVDLARLVARHGRLPVGPAVEIAAEVAGALQAAWETSGPEGAPLHLLHRDIKPSNIQITPFGEVKVLDFGIARAQFAGREAMTRDNAYGSPPYMSPERLALEESGPGADVYAVGIVLYELLLGESFGRTSADGTRHVARTRIRIDRLAQLHPGWPELPALLERILAFEPEARPAAVEVERELYALLQVSGDERLRFWAGPAVREAMGPGAPAEADDEPDDDPDTEPDPWIGKDFAEQAEATATREKVEEDERRRFLVRIVTAVGGIGAVVAALLVLVLVLVAVGLFRGGSAGQAAEGARAANVPEIPPEEAPTDTDGAIPVTPLDDPPPDLIPPVEARPKPPPAIPPRLTPPVVTPPVVTPPVVTPPVVTATKELVKVVEPPKTAAGVSVRAEGPGGAAEVEDADRISIGLAGAPRIALPGKAPPGLYSVWIKCDGSDVLALAELKVTEAAEVVLCCNCASEKCSKGPGSCR